jgi:hypothetical protein
MFLCEIVEQYCMELLNDFLDYNQDWCDHKNIRLINCRRTEFGFETGWITLVLEKDMLKRIVLEPKHRLEKKLRTAFRIPDDEKQIYFDKPICRKNLTKFVEWSMKNGTSTHVHGHMWGGDYRFYQVAISGSMYMDEVFGKRNYS